MKKLFVLVLSVLMSISLLVISTSAATTHTVVSGDSMWKIAVKYQVGLSEIKAANPQISNPNLIYPGNEVRLP